MKKWVLKVYLDSSELNSHFEAPLYLLHAYSFMNISFLIEFLSLIQFVKFGRRRVNQIRHERILYQVTSRTYMYKRCNTPTQILIDSTEQTSEIRFAFNPNNAHQKKK